MEFINKIWHFLKASPIKYYHAHSMVAALIMFVWVAISGHWIDGAVMGALFYVSREYAQWEYNRRVDWKGLLWPIMTNFIVTVIHEIL